MQWVLLYYPLPETGPVPHEDICRHAELAEQLLGGRLSGRPAAAGWRHSPRSSVRRIEAAAQAAAQAKAAVAAQAEAEAAAGLRRCGVPQLSLPEERIMQRAVTSLLFERPHEVHPAELSLGAAVGGGGFGAVRLGTWRGRAVAVRALPAEA